MAEPAWLEPLERAVNRRIAESETATARLATLGGQRFGIRIRGVPGMLCLCADGDRVTLRLAGEDAATDASVRASIVALGALGGDGGESLIRESRVEIHGDAEVAQQFRQLLHAVGPDWEEELSRLIGDIAAHQLARSVRAAGELSTRLLESAARQVAQYLQHDSGVLVPHERQSRFSAAVERLRDDADRLAARVARLEQQRRGPGGNPE